jgi:uncharacterized membrane protein YfcA
VPLLLFLAAMVGGALNSVAGGGSFIGLPALLYAGISPVAANATTTFALWPGSAAAAVAYRRNIVTKGPQVTALAVVSLIGGFLGGLLLVRTSDSSFMRLLPWLMLIAAVIFTFGDSIGARVLGRRDPPPQGFSTWALALQLVISMYGGYFGGGMGIMMLATMSIAGMRDIHDMNGLKSILAVAINAVALATFIVDGAIVWTPGFVMAAGGILGGFAGASIARRLDRRVIGFFIIVVAWAMTFYFFLRRP